MKTTNQEIKISRCGSQHQFGTWVEGSYNGYKFEALVFTERSSYGIDDGKVSKLEIKRAGETVAYYDCGWDVKPKSERVLNKIVAALESFEL